MGGILVGTQSSDKIQQLVLIQPHQGVPTEVGCRWGWPLVLGGDSHGNAGDSTELNVLRAQGVKDFRLDLARVVASNSDASWKICGLQDSATGLSDRGRELVQPEGTVITGAAIRPEGVHA